MPEVSDRAHAYVLPRGMGVPNVRPKGDHLEIGIFFANETALQSSMDGFDFKFLAKGGLIDFLKALNQRVVGRWLPAGVSVFMARVEVCESARRFNAASEFVAERGAGTASEEIDIGFLGSDLGPG